MNVLIWYDAKLKVYRSGTLKDLKNESILSRGEGKFHVLYEFKNASIQLVDRMLLSLNSLKLPNQ
ncbi:MAG: hypothetical protein ACFHWX_08720 [Bacteroidota bacterium]